MHGKSSRYRTTRPIDDRRYPWASRIPVTNPSAIRVCTTPARGTEAYRSLPNRNAGGSNSALTNHASALTTIATARTLSPRQGEATIAKTIPHMRQMLTPSSMPTGGPRSGSNMLPPSRSAYTRRAPNTAEAAMTPARMPALNGPARRAPSTQCTEGKDSKKGRVWGLGFGVWGTNRDVTRGGA